MIHVSIRIVEVQKMKNEVCLSMQKFKPYHIIESIVHIDNKLGHG